MNETLVLQELIFEWILYICVGFFYKEGDDLSSWFLLAFSFCKHIFVFQLAHWEIIKKNSDKNHKK